MRASSTTPAIIETAFTTTTTSAERPPRTISTTTASATAHTPLSSLPSPISQALPSSSTNRLKLNPPPYSHHPHPSKHTTPPIASLTFLTPLPPQLEDALRPRHR
ncbi:hypothetical protein HYDPIDRAFT_113113 [Hydnomerulius pinastri MD-312]|uniref:Uncharacterized protein n=1 Tax=Hydnomerulius pinastri MD-312 TaxID=994086 RepID=A0A0C9W877_9AGAM|nr:hypothetical protein HYDPIDRAFT_113113 [Hydnomerulius pinastri MD-312]